MSPDDAPSLAAGAAVAEALALAGLPPSAAACLAGSASAAIAAIAATDPTAAAAMLLATPEGRAIVGGLASHDASPGPTAPAPTLPDDPRDVRGTVAAIGRWRAWAAENQAQASRLR